MATRKGGGGDISERIIEHLRESVHAGVPWIVPLNPSRDYSALILLGTGHFYFPGFIHDNGDIETMTEIWSELREDILQQHAMLWQKAFQTNPIFRHETVWAWWALEDREPRRRLNRRPCACPPGAVFAGLPPLNLSWFGHVRGCRCEYENEREYLKRFGLLTRAENKET